MMPVLGDSGGVRPQKGKLRGVRGTGMRFRTASLNRSFQV